MKPDRLELVACKDVLGLTVPEALPATASQALEDGYDSPSLRILAGLTATEMDEARSLFSRALHELGLRQPTKRDAVLRLAREIARRIMSEELGHYEGARQIWDLSLLLVDENLPELDSFIYAASEWEDRPEDRQIFEDGIAAAARQLVSPSEFS